MKLVLAEKPSVAQSIAKVLGAAKREDNLSKSHFCIIDSRSNVQLVIVQVAGGAERRNAEDCGDIAAAYPLPAVCQPFLLGEVFGADQHLGFLPYVLRHPQPLLSRWR